MTIPLLKNYEQVNFAQMPAHPVSDSFQRLGHTLKDIKREKNIFLYLLAFFFFIDGVYTIIEMATAYGSASSNPVESSPNALPYADCSVSVCTYFCKMF